MRLIYRQLIFIEVDVLREVPNYPQVFPIMTLLLIIYPVLGRSWHYNSPSGIWSIIDLMSGSTRELYGIRKDQKCVTNSH